MLEAFGGERENCAVTCKENRRAGALFDDADLCHAYARFLAGGLECGSVWQRDGGENLVVIAP